MEATIIRLDPTQGASDVSVRMGTFEEAFGEYSEARGKGRARRKARKMDRIANKRAVRTERRKLKSDRQEERIGRRATRKERRQEMRNQQQEARQNRRANVRDERQANREARNLRKMTTEEGNQERENYGQEEANYRESIAPQDSEQDTQTGGGYSDEQSGGYADEQGGGYSDEQSGGYADEQGYNDSEDWNTPPEGYDEQDSGNGGYGDDNTQETPYNQEESEFRDDSYFNVEGMDGKIVVSSMVKDNVTKLRNNQSAFKNLKDRRNLMSRNGDNTRGVDMQMKKCYGRINELKNQLEKYCLESSNPQVCERRKKEVKMALGGGSKARKVGQYGGSEVPVSSELNAEFETNKITVPASSNFDAYSDLGRPIIVNGVAQSDSTYSSEDLLTDSEEPTTIELFSNADGNKTVNTKLLVSVAIGIGVGALAIYVAKKKGWI